MRTKSTRDQKEASAMFLAYELFESVPFLHQAKPLGTLRQAEPEPDNLAKMESFLQESFFPKPVEKPKARAEKNEAEEAMPAFLGKEFCE